MNVPKLRFRDNDGQKFPSWHAKKIGDFVTSHKGGAPLKPSDFIKEGSFEVIPKKAISSGGYLLLDKAEPTYCTVEFFEKNQRSVVDKNYLITTLRDLVPSGPSIGYIVKFNNDNKYILAQGVYGIKISDDLLGDFLIQYSNTDNYRVLMQTMMVGSTQVHIRNSDFFQTPFCVPCLKEQTKIANFLTAVDKKISFLTQKSDLLAQYKKGVIQKIFSQELRFKDDDGREFPEWEEITLSKLGKSFNGLTGKAGDDFGDGKPYITYKQIFDDSKIDVNKFSYVQIAENENQNQVKYGDVFFTTSSETPEEVGYCSVLLNDVNDVYLNSFCFGYRINSFDKLHPNFARFIFKSPDFRRDVVKLAQGSTRYNISKTNFMEISIKLPLIDEQTKIANFLTAIDDKITQTQAELDAVKQYKQGLLQQMFV